MPIRDVAKHHQGMKELPKGQSQGSGGTVEERTHPQKKGLTKAHAPTCTADFTLSSVALIFPFLNTSVYCIVLPLLCSDILRLGVHIACPYSLYEQKEPPLDLT